MSDNITLPREELEQVLRTLEHASIFISTRERMHPVGIELYANAISTLRARLEQNNLCSDCPPIGYPTDETHCAPCPRRAQPEQRPEWDAWPPTIREALEFYAKGSHFVRHDDNPWDTVSDEPSNFWEHEDGSATVEDGSVAKAALEASPPPRQEQKAEPREPVAQRRWLDANDGSNCGWWEYEDVDADEPLHEGYQPLYAAPPRQELSEEEIEGHPMQPVALDDKGTPRFRANLIVRYLLDHGPFDMNHLAVQGFSDEDQMQFAQLIGYSTSGYGELSYVSDASSEASDRAAERAIERKVRG